MDVREAARRTLGAGSARVWMRAFLDRPPAHPIIGLFLQTVEGVADLTRRRARLEMLHTPEMHAVAEWVESKWPWLDDGEEAEGEDVASAETIAMGGRRYVRHGEGWMLADYGSQLDNPAWILDALAGASGASRVGAEDVRGVTCERHALEPVDLRAAARANNGSLELPPHGSLGHPTVRGDIWVDADGLIRRVMWSQPPRGRPRRRREPMHRLWHCVELWDFGLPVTIEAPETGPQPDYGPLLPTLWEAGTTLWRWRADYRRRH